MCVKVYYILCYFLILPVILLGQFSASIPSNFSSVNLSPSVSFAIDTTDHLPVSQVVESLDFLPVEKEIVNLGIQSHTVWLSADIHRTASSPSHLILEVRSPHTNFIRLFIIRPDGTIDSSYAAVGDLQPLQHRRIPHRYPVFPLEDLEIGKSRLLFQVQNLAEVVYMPIFLSTKEDFWNHQSDTALFLGLSLGGLCFIFVLAMLFSLFTGERLWGYYALMLLGGLSFCFSQQGLDFLYLLPYASFLSNISLTQLSLNIWIGASVLFAIQVLKSKDLMPNWWKWLRILSMILFFFASLYVLGAVVDYVGKKWQSLVVMVLVLNHLLIYLAFFLNIFIGYQYFQKTRRVAGLLFSLCFLTYIVMGLLWFSNHHGLIHVGYRFAIEHFPIVILLVEAVLLGLIILLILRDQRKQWQQQKNAFLQFQQQAQLPRQNDPAVNLNKPGSHHWQEGKSSEEDQEDAFLQHIQQIVIQHQRNHQLNVTTLCKELGMARTPLHNKLKALTGMSTTEFVRFVRLSKAKELLLNPDLNVSEVAYMTGFQNHTYFSRKFKEVVGVTPKAWREGGGSESDS